MLSVNPPTQSSRTPHFTRLSINPICVALGPCPREAVSSPGRSGLRLCNFYGAEYFYGFGADASGAKLWI